MGTTTGAITMFAYSFDICVCVCVGASLLSSRSFNSTVKDSTIKGMHHIKRKRYNNHTHTPHVIRHAHKKQCNGAEWTSKRNKNEITLKAKAFAV